MIKAECHSDDRCVEVNFDATPWFEQATDKQITELANIGWGGDYPADDVADFMEKTNSEIQQMKTYIGLRQRIETIGYECHVSPEEARSWLKANRPVLFAALEEI